MTMKRGLIEMSIVQQHIYNSSILDSFQWSLEISLQEDFLKLMCKKLPQMGYPHIGHADDIYQLFNIIKRNIKCVPRNVVHSKQFSCPIEYSFALQEFEKKVTNGEDLTPFMSEKILLPNYNDLLLNDWGIHHFHLSRRYRPDGFVQRNTLQILAYVSDSTVYMIQVYPHNAQNLYAKQEMIQIINENWPELIEAYCLKDAYLPDPLDDNTYELYRKAHISTFVQVGTKGLCSSFGGGYASNGFSVEALRNGDFWKKRFTMFEKITLSNVEWIGKNIDSMYGKINKRCVLKIKMLWMDSVDEITMCEEISKSIIQINIQSGFMRICKPAEIFLKE